MNNMPFSVLLSIFVLVGWPLVKLGAALIARKYWRRLHSIEKALLEDTNYDNDDDRLIIATQRADASAQPIYLLMPIIVFFGGFAFSIAEICGQTNVVLDVDNIERVSERQFFALYGSRPLVRDKRFHEFVDVSMVLVALHYPVCSILTILSLVVVAPTILVAGGLKSSFHTIILQVIRSSAAAALMFGRGLGASKTA